MVAAPTSVLAVLSTRALARAARGRGSRGGALALTAATAATATAAAAVGGSIVSRVRASRDVLQQIADDGHLDLRCEGRRHDDIGALNRATNQVLENFESVVRDVAGKSETLLDGIEALGAGCQELSAAGDQAAASADPEAPTYPALAMQTVLAAAYTLHGLCGSFRVGPPAAGHARRFPGKGIAPFSY